MRRAIVLSIIIVGLGSGLASQANANPAQIYGRWVEEGSNGAEMVTEFTARSISSYGLDPSGNRVGKDNRSPVTYKDVDPSTVQVNFQTGGGLLVHIQDKDTITVDFPGMGSRMMTRDNP
jgi:hypothetical protein